MTLAEAVTYEAEVRDTKLPSPGLMLTWLYRADVGLSTYPLRGNPIREVSQAEQSSQWLTPSDWQERWK